MLRFLIVAAMTLVALSSPAGARPYHHHGHRHHHSHHHAAAPAPAPTFGFAGDLVARARAYLGTNPTGWRRLWCGRFMELVAPAAAARIPNPAWARDWAGLPHTTAHVGAVAVMRRRGGGHVGIVSGFTSNGDVIVISGNHNHRVAESVYSRSRVLAYVDAE